MDLVSRNGIILTHKCYLSFTFLPFHGSTSYGGWIGVMFRSYRNTHPHEQTHKRNQFMDSKQSLCFKVSPGKVRICPCCAACSLVSIWLLLVSSVQGPRLHSRRAIPPLESKSPEWAWDSPMFAVSNGPFLALYSVPSTSFSSKSTLIYNLT